MFIPQISEQKEKLISLSISPEFYRDLFVYVWNKQESKIIDGFSHTKNLKILILFYLEGSNSGKLFARSIALSSKIN